MRIGIVGMIAVSVLAASAMPGCSSKSGEVEKGLCSLAAELGENALKEARQSMTEAERLLTWVRSFAPAEVPAGEREKRLRALPSFPGDGPASAAATRCMGARRLLEASLSAYTLLSRNDLAAAQIKDVRSDSSWDCQGLERPYADGSGADKAVKALGASIRKAEEGLRRLPPACGCTK